MLEALWRHGTIPFINEALTRFSFCLGRGIVLFTLLYIEKGVAWLGWGSPAH